MSNNCSQWERVRWLPVLFCPDGLIRLSYPCSHDLVTLGPHFFLTHICTLSSSIPWWIIFWNYLSKNGVQDSLLSFPIIFPNRCSTRPDQHIFKARLGGEKTKIYFTASPNSARKKLTCKAKTCKSGAFRKNTFWMKTLWKNTLSRNYTLEK